MKIEWSEENKKGVSDWHFGKTNSRFRIEIGPNTNGNFSWIIFHEDFKNAVYGDTANTIEIAKQKSIAWLSSTSI